MRLLRSVTAGILLIGGTLKCQTPSASIVIFHTNLGDLNVQLLPGSAPKTVANFLSYMNSGAYNNSFVHRSIPGFVWQGGGYSLVDGNVTAIPANAPVANEFAVPNTEGTLAMALVGTDINSATTQWFFNEVDNSSSLDPQSFTVFGRILPCDPASKTVLDSIATVPVFDLSQPFDQIPLVNYSSGPVQDSNLVMVESISAAAPGTTPAGPPFGSFDTPESSITDVAGAVGFTGWALSCSGSTNLGIYRDPLPNEPTQANGLAFIGNAVFTTGARPDVAALYPAYPDNNSGWGLQVLTNELPGTQGQAQGNGTYTLHAIATDANGVNVEIGAKTIVVNNAGSKLPFGTIDTPSQGGVASGTAFVNFGWALTPQPNMIATNGSTISVYIDGLPKGHPVYGNARSDIQSAFPGYLNTNGAVGYFLIDTTQLTNGLHTIAWSVTDNAGNTSGIGSRFFTVQNDISLLAAH